MGLKISLAPSERLYVNGAKISNPGTKSIRIEIDNEATVMRESAFIQPENVQTSLQYLAFIAQCLYLKAGDEAQQKDQFVKAMALALSEAQTVEDKQQLVKIGVLANDHQWSRCLSLLWQMLRAADEQAASA